MESMVTLRHVIKSFKEKTAVDRVSFTIQKGEIVAILGRNGAGKSTTLKMMLGLLKPTSGELEILGGDPRLKRVRDRIGAMLQEASVLDALTVREIIQLVRSYYSRPLSFEELVLLTEFNETELKMRAEKLSGGQKRRLNFALAMVGNPELLLLDEPTVGLDVTARNQFWNTIEKLKRCGKTILFTTHYLQEADEVAERIILFHQGKVIADGSPELIKSKLTKQVVSFVLQDRVVVPDWRQLPHVSDVYEKEGRIHLVSDDTDLVLAKLLEQKVIVKNIRIEHGNLADAFDQLTRQDEGVL